MKRWNLPADSTSADDLILEDVPTPEPGSGEVRIRVQAISVNGRDQMVLGEGPFGRLPGEDLVPLSDVAGEIDAIGADVEDFAVGDRVTNLHFRDWVDGPPPANSGLGLGALDEPGVLAEYVVLPATRITAAPRNLDASEAATLPVAGVTAWNAVFGDRPVGEGDSILALGSGGVSIFALQLATGVGADTHIVHRDQSRAESMQALGAASTLTIENGEAWGERAFEATGGVTKVVDTVGPALLGQEMATLAPGGEVAVLGLKELVTEPLDVMALMGKQASVRGIAVGSHQMHRDLVAFIEEHDVHPVIDRRFGFDEAPDAYRAHAAPGVVGKIVIEVG